MDVIMSVLSYCIDPRFFILCFLGSLAGLFVGSIPGLSVSMATALLVSITYTGAPSSVVTTLDGFPLANRGEAFKALKYTTFYSFVGSVFGMVALAILAKPITSIALKFQPMDYFLLALFGLATVGSLTTKSFSKGLISALIGVFLALIGLDSVVGTPRLTFGIQDLKSGISTVPALVGLFGFAEVLSVIADGAVDGAVSEIKKEVVKIKDIMKEFWRSMYYCTIGILVGALPGAGGPVAAFLAYGEAKRIVKKPSRPFGEGAVEGIVASESSNNACIGGALIPMLTLAIPGDAVTAIILSVFYVHGLQPGPTFLKTSASSFYAILAGGFLGCLFLMILGMLVAPRISRIISVPKRILLPIVILLCVIGAYACSNRLFDVVLMFLFGIFGLFLRNRGYSVAPVTLGLVLGKMMDANFRRAVSLASSTDNVPMALFGRPITIVLLTVTILTIFYNVPAVKRMKQKRKAVRLVE